MAATLKDVAQAAGVSIRTAGRALRGTGPVKASAAESVRRAAKQLNYVPNAAARSLRNCSSRIAGVMIGNMVRSEAGQRRLLHLESILRERGFHTLLGSLPRQEEELLALLHSWTGIAERVIFLDWNSRWSATALKSLPQRFLFLDCDMPDAEFDSVQTDRACGSAAAVEALIASGRRRIIHVFNGGAQGRRAGVEQSAAAHSGVEIRFLETGGLDLEDGFRAGPAIAGSGADAVFFDTDRMALGFYRYAHENGIAIPEKIAVAGFDNDSAGAYAIPSLTTVAHPDAEAAACAAAWVEGREKSPLRRVFRTHLITRESIT